MDMIRSGETKANYFHCPDGVTWSMLVTVELVDLRNILGTELAGTDKIISWGIVREGGR